MENLWYISAIGAKIFDLIPIGNSRYFNGLRD